ncbi:DUF3263 domain-containing protein [Agrococcus sp. Ld7]|uniref:DUF3263 domain-containing protein n=1 Tax=Agrococcus sp. Ld7 TaxID=649148 RepID=UPI00386EC0F9
MATDPRTHARSHDEATGDESAARAFASAESRASEPDGQATDAAAHDLAAAREERIRRVLDFEASWASHGGAKARAIRTEFGWTTTRYYQVLDRCLETEAAVRHDPMLVGRLLRLREAR